MFTKLKGIPLTSDMTRGKAAERAYIAIDLKSFYASVECIERGLDPLTTNLVVADESRTEKTICLAVSPSLKAYGIPGRARLFEVVQKVREVNAMRKNCITGRDFAGKSFDARELRDRNLALDYIAAVPRMRLYMEYSRKIYKIYLKYIAPEDIHVYSIDEVFIDATDYLKLYGKTARQLAMTMIQEVLKETGITATAGIGTNMYLCKIAMDIEAKHIKPDSNGVRIAELDEMSYRQKLWNHRPLTDFWRIGRGYARKLEAHGMYTMGDVAKCSVGKTNDFHNEELLYKLFGINAELLIDHAWGWEPCTIKEIKAYRPENNSLTQGQVLQRPYSYEEARVIVTEMSQMLAMDLMEKGLVADQIVLTVGYDIKSLNGSYGGEIAEDWYGRKMPKHAHGSCNIGRMTSSVRLVTDAAIDIFDRTVDRNLMVRRIHVVANHVVDEKNAKNEEQDVQLNLFTDYVKQAEEEQELQKEKDIQQALLDIQRKFGKNSVLKGTNLEEGATTIDRNKQIGGHRA